MSNLKNKVQLSGFIGRDPEVKVLPTGKTMAKASIAISEQYKNAKGEKVEETYWHNLIMWGKQAEFVGENVKKGTELAVEGKLISRSYEDKTGKKVYVTEVLVSEVVLVNKKLIEK